MTLPDLAEWESLSPQDQEAIASTVGQSRPGQPRFVGLQEHGLGGRRRRIAHFHVDETDFVLIPGGTARLGFDPDTWTATAAELESWRETAKELQLPCDIRAYLRTVVSPPRIARISPCLVEITPQELGWQPASLDDADVQDLLKPTVIPDYLPDELKAALTRRLAAAEKKGQPRTKGMFGRDTLLRVVEFPDGTKTAIRNVLPRHRDVIQHIEESGFQIPTSDEWEYFCGGGTGTLFRWGDHSPIDLYPTDVSVTEAQWRLDWLIAGGDLDPPPEGFHPDWDLHRRPNGFGLLIASISIGRELLGEPGQLRGGDGGASSCGGEGFFQGWLPLATAWCDPRSCQRDPQEPIFPSIPVARRILRLA